MGTCWCKYNNRSVSEPYLPSTSATMIMTPRTHWLQPPIETPPGSVLLRKNIDSKLIDQLVIEMLAAIATYVDNVNEMPPALVHLNLIADNDEGWVSVISSVINVTPLDNPFGPSLITVLMDDCPLPAKDTVMTLVSQFNLSSERVAAGETDVRTECNMCAVLGSIAHRLAGPICIVILTDTMLDYLCALLARRRDPNLILLALFALEKFALTNENRERIKIKMAEGEQHLLLGLEEYMNNEDLVWCQVGFFAQWALDNTFVIEGRQLTYETVDTTGINAILSHCDVSDHLKISSDGLMARCDAYTFESARCTFRVDEGCWFYECTIMTRGVMQIGWANQNSHFLDSDGYGVGDDAYSVSYDGCRRLIWHKATSSLVMDAVAWKPGDVLGCILDLLEKEIVFLLNGVPLAIHTEIFRASRNAFYAAASFMTYQQCSFNFGHKPFQFPPTDRQFLSFNDFGQLDAEEKKIVPRRLMIAELREMPIDDNACIICFNARACSFIEPCKHAGFCLICSAQFNDCPYCRGPILQIVFIEVTDENESAEGAAAEGAVAQGVVAQGAAAQVAAAQVAAAQVAAAQEAAAQRAAAQEAAAERAAAQEAAAQRVAAQRAAARRAAVQDDGAVASTSSAWVDTDMSSTR